jgi:hypothetical protein
VQENGSPRVGLILDKRKPNMRSRIYPLDDYEVVSYWTETAEEEEEDRREDRREDGSEDGSEDECEARVNVQARGEEEGDQVRVNSDEDGGRGQTCHAQARRRRIGTSIIRPPQQAVPEELPRSSSEEGLLLLVYEVSQGGRRRPVVSESLQTCMEQLRSVLLLDKLEEAKGSLEALMQVFAENDRQWRLGRSLGPEDPILLLLAQGSCYRIYRADLFCPVRPAESVSRTTRPC